MKELSKNLADTAKGSYGVIKVEGDMQGVVTKRFVLAITKDLTEQIEQLKADVDQLQKEVGELKKVKT